MSLTASLQEYSTQISEAVTLFFEAQKSAALEVDPVLKTSIVTLHEFVARGGKAIRPFLVKTAYELAQGKSNAGLIKAAAAVELHHKHILILDDIADRDEMRSGGPTVEWSYREIFKDVSSNNHRALSFAMLDGVWLGALARELLYDSGFASEQLLKCQHILNTLMFRDTLAGWEIHALECDKPIKSVTPEEFTKGLELVTARYTFEGPFKIGLTLAQNSDTSLEAALTKYSEKVGTAFQIHDDILGLFGDSAKTGKSVGNDVREGKKTLLIQFAYQNASNSDKDFLETVTGKTDISQNEIEQVKQIVIDTKSLEHSQALENKMVKDGIVAIENLPDSEQKQNLIELAWFVIQREK
jgi:geranylgeranyl diphosphate synthase type I